MRKINLIPNIITAFGLAAGLFVIFKINLVEPGMGTFEVVRTAALLILLAALADWIDGAVARAIHAVSEFGFLFDSLADAVTFGIAPSVLMLKTLSIEDKPRLVFFAIVGAMIYSICGVLRLVRFSVHASAAKHHPDLAIEHHKHFTGLPIPAAALSAVSINLFFASPMMDELLPLPPELSAMILSGVMVVIGYLMVSRIKFPSAKVLHFRLPSFQLVFFTVLLALFLLYGILYFFPLTFLILSWSYLCIGLIIALIRLIAGKKSKTLEEFEPDQED